MSIIRALIYSFNGKPQALPLNFPYAYDSRRRSIFEEHQQGVEIIITRIVSEGCHAHDLVSGPALATVAANTPLSSSSSPP